MCRRLFGEWNTAWERTSFEAAQCFGFGVPGGETFAVVVATGAIDATPACIAKQASDRNLCVGALVG